MEIEEIKEEIQSQWREIDEKTTPEGLKDSLEKIFKRIADNQAQRVVVPKRHMKLFDENQSSKEASDKINQFAKSLFSM